MILGGPTAARGTPPLDVARVLDEEYRALSESAGAGPLPTALPGWRLTGEQVVAPARFLARLRGESNVARYFRQQLPATTLALLQASDPATTAALLASLVDDLNRLLEAGRLLYDETRLPDVRVDPDLQALVSLRPGGGDLVQVNRLLLEQAFGGEFQRIYDVRLRAVHARIHAGAKGDAGKPRTALCLSGGGIRSATFGLGVLQGLARLGLLDRFDYLSTVSGGGYVGAWLTSWIHRHRDGTAGVAGELGNARPTSPVMPEPRPIHHLREYSNYMSPRLGMLSADTWTLVGIYLRNLILNWTVLIPLLLGVLAVPRLVLALVLLDPGPGWREAVLGVGFLALVMAVVYVTLFRPSLEEQRRRLPPWLRRRGTQGWFLVLCLAPLLLSAALLTTYWSWRSAAPPASSDLGVIAMLAGFGAGLHVVTWVVSALLLRRFARRELAVTASTGAVAGLLAGVVATRLLPAAPVWSYAAYYVCFAVPLFVAAFLLAATVFVGLVSQFTTDEDREWWARFGAWTLIVQAGWMVGSALVILGPPALLYSWTTLVSSLSIGTIAGFVAVLLGKSGKTGGSGTPGAAAGTSALMDHAVTLAAPIALLLIVALLSLATTGAIAALDANPWVPILRDCSNWPVVDPPLPVLLHPPRHEEVLHCSPPWFLSGVIGLLVVVAFVASYFIDVNKFSLHAMYRARLIRAYLGASRERRTPNPFTGFDPLDDVQMHELRDEAFTPGSFKDLPAFVNRLREPPAGDRLAGVLRGELSPETRAALATHVPGTEPSGTLARQLLEDLNLVLDTVALDAEPAAHAPARGATPATAADGEPPLSRRNRALLDAAYPDEIRPASPPPRRPLHVLNMALNLVGGHNLAWQERKAETFTVTELHAGSYHLGYRRAHEYGGERPRGLSLGTAVAISGAAASPNMGYHSSPIVTFLMAMFNARLGWWLGNPGPHGHATFGRDTPLVSILPMLREALGMTDDVDTYVYLSDGGHFENLGLFEMVLRRCHLIVISDAGCDPRCTFEDLANAIRKVRVDLGVPITIAERLRIRARAAEARGAEDGTYFAVAKIGYAEVDRDGVDGTLIYLKPSVYGAEPVDVLNYALGHPAFPHESTGDQFFSESQFESYRQLGLHTILTVLREPRRRGP